MPRTKKQGLVFAFIMCTFMCTIMSAYNIILHTGLNYNSLFIWAHTIMQNFIFAFLVSYILVNPLAKKISFKLTQKNPKNRGLFIALFMVIGMVLIMSMYGTINSGADNFLTSYLINVIYSFIFALPLQLFLVGPIVRGIFKSLVSFRAKTLREA